MKLSSFERYPGQVVFLRLIEKAFQTTWGFWTSFRELDFCCDPSSLAAGYGAT